MTIINNIHQHERYQQPSKVVWFVILICCFLFINTRISAQSFMGMTISSYSGVMGVDVQPASLASTPYSFDLNLINASANGLINNFIPTTSIGNVFYSGKNYEIGTVLSVTANKFWIDASIDMPSLSIRINEKSGIAFNWRVGAISYGQFSDGTISLMAANEFDTKILYEAPILQNMVGIVNAWEDFSLSYGRKIISTGQHQLDAGLSVSYVAGGASGYIQSDALNIEYDANTNTLEHVDGTISLIYNSKLDEISEGESKKLFSSSGFGFRFGFVYKFLTKKHLAKTHDRLGNPNYLLKFSTSVRDLGKIYYDASENAATYKIHLNHPINGDYFSNIESISDLSHRIKDIGYFERVMVDDYSLRLPTTFNFNLDWNIWKSVYANMLVDITYIDIRKSISTSTTLTNYQLTGRWEKAKYGIYLGVEYNEAYKWSTSLAVRYSVFFIGASNILSFINDKPTRTIGLMLGFKVPFLTKSEAGKNRIF